MRRLFKARTSCYPSPLTQPFEGCFLLWGSLAGGIWLPTPWSFPVRVMKAPGCYFWLLLSPVTCLSSFDTLLVLLCICEMLQSMEISKLQFSPQQLVSSYATLIFWDWGVGAGTAGPVSMGMAGDQHQSGFGTQTF